MKLTPLLFVVLLFLGQATVAIENHSTREQKVVISKDNLIVLNQEISPEFMGNVILQAKTLDAALSSKLSNSVSRKVGLERKEPLYIFINSPGGSIQTGLELIEALKGLGRPVHTITLFAASMAFQLVQQLDKRYVLHNGVMMSHRAAGGFEGSFGGQYPSQIDSRYALWMNRLNEMDEQTVKRTNGKQTLASYQKQYASEMWLTGSQSVAQGYSDAVITLKCDESLQGVENKNIKLNLGVATVDISYDSDLCPINTNPINLKIILNTTKGKIELNSFLAQGGQFGNNCLQSSDKNKICALDPNLDLFKINEAVDKFKLQGQFDSSKQRPIPMY